jgi:hypothetical protein
VILEAISMYWQSLAYVHKGVLHKIGRNIFSFLWTRENEKENMALVTWGKLAMPKSIGEWGLVGSQPNFFSIALKSCLHLLSYYDKPLSHCDNGHSSYFCDHYNSISTEVFTTASVKTLFSLIRLSSSSVDT